MRKLLSDYLNNKKDKSIYLLHADMWHYKTFNAINCGIIEPSVVSIASGLAHSGKHVLIYGVCGFILYRAFDQIKFMLTQRNFSGSVTFLNAGANGCYDKKLGRSHQILDDKELCKLLNINLIEPTYEDFISVLENSLKNKITFIRLGFDR